MKLVLAVSLAFLLTGCWFHKEVVVIKHLPIPAFMLEPCDLPAPLAEDRVISVRDLAVEMQIRQGDHIACAKKLGRVIDRERQLTEQEGKQ